MVFGFDCQDRLLVVQVPIEVCDSRVVMACLSDDLAVVPEDSLGWHEERARAAGVLPDPEELLAGDEYGVDLGEFGGFVEELDDLLDFSLIVEHVFSMNVRLTIVVKIKGTIAFEAYYISYK